MPKSTHRRKGKVRKRAHQVTEPERNPEPSPPWVPVLGVSLLVLGLLVIVVNYIIGGSITAGWPLFGTNWGLVVGFVAMLGGFITLTYWQ